MRAACLLLLGSLLAAGPAAGQISPGPLARAHRGVAGALQCTACHAGGKDALSANCAGCHRDITWLAARGRGYHARDGRGACASCHPDHAGEGFALIRWPEGGAERFDHARAGWALTGKHRALACDKCHTGAYRVSPAARLSARRSGPGWTGLEPTCTACHEDAHRGALGTTCETCHETARWTDTPGFDHDSTRYRLTGRHVEVACDRCHANPRLPLLRDATGKPVPIYRPVPHAECSACHRDPHAGRLGPECGACHGTESFTAMSRNRFDHERTRYPLRGRHAAVPCARCHDFRTAEGKRPAFATCTACHRDPHGGTATLAGASVDCAACHDVGGFRPGTLTVRRHQDTGYPLEGRHREVRCSACHVKESGTAPSRWGTARVVMRPAYGACRDCHADDHGTQLAGRSDGGDCAACHDVGGWTPSRFDRRAHASLRVPLEGRHAAITCDACHATRRPGLPPVTASPAVLGRAGVVLHVKETACADCHRDPHRGRFAAGGARPVPGGCAACHGTSGFRPSTVGVTAHAGYAFALEGAHRAVPCVACHVELAAPAASHPDGRWSLAAATAPLPLTTFAAATACADCHRTPHGDQFAGRADRGRCDACHGADAFAPAARFDHDRDAAFALRGAHAAVPCARCHPGDASGARRRVYRPLPTTCESCHGPRRGR